MKPSELTRFLQGLIQHQVRISTMIWGPPGIGKSSIVQQTAAAFGLDFIDLRLSQLAPTDLRGLPVAHDGVSRWYPPEFLPQDGAGILFLDELNLAPPTMQGMAQQLILDRRVGNYVVPDGWYIWAAGNRKEDRAAVFDMPAPLANRFLHLEVEADLASFKAYALASGLPEQFISFLAFRPELLHKMDTQQSAWPSPRSWEMASQLYRANLAVDAAVGPAAAAEFNAYCAIYQNLPSLEPILQGEGDDIPFPTEPSVRYALTLALALRAENAGTAYHALRWLTHHAEPEWVQRCTVDLFPRLRASGAMRDLQARIAADDEMQAYLEEHARLLEL